MNMLAGVPAVIINMGQNLDRKPFSKDDKTERDKKPEISEPC